MAPPSTEPETSAGASQNGEQMNNSSEQPQTLTFYPFAYALLDDELDSHCWYCLTPARDEHKLLRCTACHAAWFCSRSCQELGWFDHKPECKALKRIKILNETNNNGGKTVPLPGVEVRHLGRIASRHKLIVDGKDTPTDKFYLNRTSNRTILQLWSHADDIRQDPPALKKFEDIYQQLTSLYSNKDLPDKETVYQLHCRNYINRHAISNVDYLREIGKGLYLDLCAYDHSCRPNTIYSCDGFIATLRPLHSDVNITSTATTFYSYIDLFNTKQQRKKLLKDTWYFDCQCERCVDENEHVLSSVICHSCAEPVILFGQKSKRDIDRFAFICANCDTPCPKERVTEAITTMRYIDSLTDGDQIDQHENPLEFVQELLTRYASLLPKVNVYFTRLLQAAIRLTPSTAHGDLLRLHLAACDCLTVCYPVNHPAIAYHHMSIGLMAMKCNQTELANQHLVDSIQMLTTSLGAEHQMTKLAESYLQQCAQQTNSGAHIVCTEDAQQ